MSNFLEPHLDTLRASSDVIPAVNQIEIHPTFQQRDLVATSRSRGIAVDAYSPLGQGADLDCGTVKYPAAKYAVTPTQIVLACHLSTGNIAIPKTSSADRMRQNFEAAAIILSPSELTVLAAMKNCPQAATKVPTDGQQNCPTVAMRSAHFLTEPTAS